MGRDFTHSLGFLQGPETSSSSVSSQSEHYKTAGTSERHHESAAELTKWAWKHVVNVQYMSFLWSCLIVRNGWNSCHSQVINNEQDFHQGWWSIYSRQLMINSWYYVCDASLLWSKWQTCFPAFLLCTECKQRSSQALETLWCSSASTSNMLHFDWALCGSIATIASQPASRWCFRTVCCVFKASNLITVVIELHDVHWS